jgi:hypothetical protein
MLPYTRSTNGSYWIWINFKPCSLSIVSKKIKPSLICNLHGYFGSGFYDSGLLPPNFISNNESKFESCLLHSHI